MSQIVKTFFSIQEFASICGTTKNTLYHYDEIGLFKPDRVENNGYRKYSMEQFFQFDVIVTLRDSGASLKEIKRYLLHKNPQDFLAFLKIQRQRLAQEQRRMERLVHVLDCYRERTSQSLSAVPGKCHIEWQDEAYFAVTECISRFASEEEQVLAVKKVYGKSKDFVYFAPVCTIVDYQHLIQKDADTCRFGMQVQKPRQGLSGVHVKHAGYYAVYIFQGPYGKAINAYDKLFTFIDDSTAIIIGNAYEEDMRTYITEEDTEHFLIKISVGVSEPGKRL